MGLLSFIGALAFFVLGVALRLRGWKPSLSYDIAFGRVSERCVAALLQPPAPIPYDAAASFRADMSSCNCPMTWVSDDFVSRAIRLAEQETGAYPGPGNAGSQALMRYAILGGKISRGAELTPDEKRILERLDGQDEAGSRGEQNPLQPRRDRSALLNGGP